MSDAHGENELPGTSEATSTLPPASGEPAWAAASSEQTQHLGAQAPHTGPQSQQFGAHAPWGQAAPGYGPIPPGAPQPGWTGAGPVWSQPSGGWPPFPGAYQAEPPKKRRGVPLAAAVGLAVVAAAAGVGVGHEVWHSPTTINASPSGSSNLPGSTNGNGEGGVSPFGFGNQGSNGSEGSGTSQASGSPSNVSAIAAQVDPALVDVNVTFGYQSASGAGTGIVLTSNGEILTNNHVIDGATSISVTDIGNGKTYSATVVGYDNTHDVAVLQLSGASGLKTAKIADSSKVTVGEGVVAIGNAGGTGGTPSSAGGSVTALNQSITASDELDGTNEQLSGLIQVNADVQSGDSGGSLVNSSGQVIGMDTAASSNYSFQSSAGNSGYAIPINSALAIAQQIESGQGSGDVHVGATAFLGVLIQPAGQSGGSGQNGFGGNGGGSQSVNGAYVSGVLSGTTAANAGLAQGDTITSLNGQSVSSSADLTKIVGTLKPGQHVELGWTDSSGQSHTTTVDMGSGPPA